MVGDVSSRDNQSVIFHQQSVRFLLDVLFVFFLVARSVKVKLVHVICLRGATDSQTSTAEHEQGMYIYTRALGNIRRGGKKVRKWSGQWKKYDVRTREGQRGGGTVRAAVLRGVLLSGLGTERQKEGL